jgi:hypothetical protein
MFRDTPSGPTMSPVITENDEWIGVRRAASIAGTTCYSLKTAALAGLIRTRLRPPFRTVFHRGDVEAMRAAFDAS